MNETEQQKHKHNPAEKKILVRYGHSGQLGWFSHNQTTLPKCKSKVMIKTERGLEIGEVLGRFNLKGGNFKKNATETAEYYEKPLEESPVTDGGKFVRYATEQDLNEQKHINENAKAELATCKRLVKEMNLQMKMVDIEHVFGGERIIFYFTAENRVDFRELVKQLAKEFQTRIEMRQLGSRDAAKITADIEVCGQPCCCGRYLKILKPVNMKMAKLQKATLDPAKISGYCGRLKCCLRYEDATYKELSKKLPKKRTRVKTSQGTGEVIEAQILTQLIKIRTDDGNIIAVPVEDIEILSNDKNYPQQKKNSNNNNNSKNNKPQRQNHNKKQQPDNTTKTDEQSEQQDKKTDE